MYLVHVPMWSNNGWHITEFNFSSEKCNAINKLLTLVFKTIKFTAVNQLSINYNLKFLMRETLADIALIVILSFVRSDIAGFSALLNVCIISRECIK